MWKPILLWLCLSGYCLAGPLGPKRNMPIIQRQEEEKEKEPTAVLHENDANKPEAANTVAASPNMLMISTLTLPSNATSIRADITDGFSCANRSYGYYADVENDCQIFHVCLPVTYADGRENTFRWSFICPEDTIFSQDSFTCMRREDMTIDCEESFKYYELNRNFGMTDEDENKNLQSGSDMNNEMHLGEDQESAMTTHLEEERPTQQTIQQQMMSDEKTEKVNAKPSKPIQIMAQKEKPMKIQKPNRRKPATSATTNAIKRKPALPLRKVTQPVTVQPVIATTVETLPEEEETKPPRFTKRPSTLSVNLKEKIQPVKQTEVTPLRVDLYNQKRKRPSILNKKDATTVKPVEEAVPTTQLFVAQEVTLPPQTQPEAEQQPGTHKSKPEPAESTGNNFHNILPQASESSQVILKPATSPVSTDSEAIENKKISKPQPTEPEAASLPDVNKIEEAPAITPLEAIEEIPAVIAEVEEINSIQQPGSNTPLKEIQTTSSHEDPVMTHIDDISSEAQVSNSPAIFQQNSEENLTPVSGPSIEDMEDQKPNDAPETMPATSDMEHQDPMIEQMFAGTDAEANKHTMGGFKPVDPAMAAEAEALIANFLNTLMKSDKTNADPIMPPGVMATDQPNNINLNENQPEEPSSQETSPQEMETEIHQTSSPVETNVHLEAQAPSVESINPFPSMMMMMNNHPGEIFQIPVQVIQSPIEELRKTENAPSDTSSTEIETSPAANPARPISIDDIVELVKDKLDHVPAADKEMEQETQDKETIKNVKDDLGAEKSTEQLIVPIYHRISSEPNENMIKAHEKDEDHIAHEETNAVPVSAANIPETESKAETKPPTIADTQLNTDRTQRARSIKSAVKMDPRKRRFLFKSDAS